jgi:imidazolonepropionase-like amidohydrolase
MRGVSPGRGLNVVSERSFVLRGAAVLDETGAFDGPRDIRVEDGVVAAVGPNLAAGGAAEHDFAGLLVMPGVFDCHDHVSMSTLDVAEALRTPLSQWALETARNARTTLEAGVTFVRDLAGADAGIRDALARGYVPGPTLQVSIVLLSQTGGHGDGFLAGPGLELSPGYLMPDYPGKPPFVVDGVDGMRHAVRALVRAGADWIKLATTGGLVSDHDHPLVPDFTPAEIGVAVSEARRKGRPVASHAYGGEGLDNAVRAGVRSIEHGGFLTEEQAARMAEAGCWLVPTLAAMRDTLRWAQDGVLSPAQCRKILDFGLKLGEAVRIAKAHGVRLASGTDYISRQQHGGNLEEVALMREAGLTSAEALLAATAWGAELCGVADRYGRIAPGYVFDALVLDEDPGDLSCFHGPSPARGVFRAGVPVVAHPRLGG